MTRGSRRAPAVAGVPFGVALGVVVGVAVAWRIGYAVAYDTGHELGGDALYYHWQGRALADGLGYLEPFVWRITGERVPSAYHPPAFSTLLGGASAVGLTSVLAHRVVAAVVGGVTVAALGLLGRAWAGSAAGLAAATLAAAYPPLWIADTQLLSEGLFAALLAVAAVLAHGTIARATPARAGALGAVVGAAALTRSEALLLVPALVVPVVVRSPVSVSVRMRACLAATAGFVALVAPWTAYNLTRFERPVPVSTGLGNLLASANCDSTYGGDGLGYWSFQCSLRASEAIEGVERDESETDAALREQALDYVGEHLGDVPRVLAARLTRTALLFRPVQQLDLERFGEDRGGAATTAGAVGWYVLVPMAIGGALLLRRRRVSLAVPAAFAVLVVVTVAIGYGTVRFRVPIDVMLPPLGAVTGDALRRRATNR